MWEGLCCSERVLILSTVEVGSRSAKEDNLSVCEGLCCFERATYWSLWALNWLEWTQYVIPSVWEGLMLH